jgi:alkanesulfonate monooxygenase SsuD/methylene tetrahydromethanopterin reductase-like flavin-dependent oxidoreductase (luciferase family)
LATGVYILPLRNPLLTARAVCTLQEASGGRCMLGIGAGWLGEEFEALQVPFDERYGRYLETVEILRLAWAGGPFEFSGKYFSFGPIQVTARPTTVPILFGGNGEKALRRAVRHGDGWFSSGTPTLPAALELKRRIEALHQDIGRNEPLRCYYRVEGFDPDLIRHYHDEGITDVAVWADKVWPPDASLGDKRASLATAADALGLEPRRA